MPTETRTFVGETATAVGDGYAGFRIGQRYTGVVQGNGQVLVLRMGAPVDGGVVLTSEQFGKWFRK